MLGQLQSIGYAVDDEHLNKFPKNDKSTVNRGVFAQFSISRLFLIYDNEGKWTLIIFLNRKAGITSTPDHKVPNISLIFFLRKIENYKN